MFLLCFLKNIIVFVNFYDGLVSFDTQIFLALEPEVKIFG